MSWTNYHSHTHYCDGNEEPEQYIISAINNKLKAYGFSAHAPVNFETDWCIPDSKFAEYMQKIGLIKQKYASEIQTYIGLEIDYIPGISGRNKHILANYDLDYFIGSIHFVDCFIDGTPWNIDFTKEFFDKGLKTIFNNSFKKASERFYEISCQMIEEDKPDIIGHLDKIKMYNNGNTYFNENEKWYREQVLNLLRSIKKTNTIVEINTRGHYRYGQKDLYPSSWIVKEMIKMGIPLMLNSDSHASDEIISGFEYATNELKKLGVKELWVLIDDKWQPKHFDASGFKW